MLRERERERIYGHLMLVFMYIRWMRHGHYSQRVAVTRKCLIEEMLEKEEDQVMMIISAPFWSQ